MTEHNISAKGMNWDWGTGDICTGDRSPETHKSGLLCETSDSQTHVGERGLSISDFCCPCKQLKVMKLGFHSKPPSKSWPQCSFYGRSTRMYLAWLLFKFHQWPQNSINPTETTTGLPAGQIRYSAACIIKPYMSWMCPTLMSYWKWKKTQKIKRDSIGNICLGRNSAKPKQTLGACSTQAKRLSNHKTRPPLISESILDSF